MGEVFKEGKRPRRAFRWSKAARDLVKANRYVRGTALSALVTKLVAESGNPRDACWRLVRQLGGHGRCRRAWTEAEQQRLLCLVARHSIKEVANLVQRSERSVRLMLQRLGASAIMGQDWFTKYTLAEALRVHVEKVNQWIDRGWLKTRVLNTGAKRTVIDADEFCRFCEEHRQEVIGHRLNRDRLDFIQNFVFPSSHARLLPVRESKKERAAYDKRFESAKYQSAGANDEEDRDGTDNELVLSA
jgi:hypothetical protein